MWDILPPIVNAQNGATIDNKNVKAIKEGFGEWYARLLGGVNSSVDAGGSWLQSTSNKGCYKEQWLAT
jgi:hypothetical protein